MCIASFKEILGDEVREKRLINERFSSTLTSGEKGKRSIGARTDESIEMQMDDGAIHLSHCSCTNGGLGTAGRASSCPSHVRLGKARSLRRPGAQPSVACMKLYTLSYF